MNDTPRMQSALMDDPTVGFANVWKVGCGMASGHLIQLPFIPLSYPFHTPFIPLSYPFHTPFIPQVGSE